MSKHAATVIAATAVAEIATGTTTRTTLVLPVALDQNLELFSVRCGMSKGEIIKKALTEFLTSQGLQPMRQPKAIRVEY